MTDGSHQFPDAGELLEHVDESIRKRRLFLPGEAILIAVSGGVDSMVLLDVLHRLAPRHGWKLAVAHFNHQLRGRSSDADERLVFLRAAELKLPALVGREDVRRFARRQGLSVELGARKLRHDFLARSATERECACIALAHHADDQLELFFLRLLRGSGSEGLGGMRWSNPSPANPVVRLSRPLLEQPKGALYAYAAARELQFREDASNGLLEIQRNRIRHNLLPLLREKYQPALDRTVLRVMDMLAEEAQVVQDAASNWLQIPTRRRRPFEALSVAVQRRCLLLQLLRLGVAPEFDVVERLRSTADTPVCVSCGTLVRDDAGSVSFQDSATVGFTTQTVDVVFQGRAGQVEFDGTRIQWQVRSSPAPVRPVKAVPRREVFDAERLGTRVRLRHWQRGDRFRPIGMEAAVKLQDLFTNAKVPRERRHELIVAEAADGEIFWVEGLRIGERFKLTPQTIRGLHWRWQRL